MYCLRCGRETADGCVFCDLCQQNMEQYPVKPGTPIHLPHRVAAAVPKKRLRRKRAATAEEQVLQLKKSLRRTRAFAAALIILVGLAIAGAFYWITREDVPDIGKNYNVDTTLNTD